MLSFIRQRIFIAIPLLVMISIASFAIILLPPGSYVETYIQRLEERGFLADESTVEQLYRQYGLDRGPAVQYYRWMRNFLLKGEMGRSFIYNVPVKDIILERLPLSIAFTLAAFAVTWIIAVPLGIYSAVRQYSLTDYLATTMSFLGLAVPNFLLALGLAYLVFVYTGHAITSLYSLEFRNAPWSWPKLVDVAKNAWLAVFVIAVGGTAPLVRILRGTLLDELKKLYVTTARAKGLRESRVIFKYPVRIASTHWSAPSADAAGSGQRRGDRVAGARPRDSGPDTPGSSAVGGHVPGGKYRDDPERSDHRRHADFRYSAGDDRSRIRFGRSVG